MTGVTIDLSKVKGHDQGYPPMTWSYMLNHLKRIDDGLAELKHNPDYYLEDFKSDLTFTEIDGCLFILVGKHRTTIAKYLTYFNPHKFPSGPLLHGVDLLRYEVNHLLMDQVQHLRTKLKNEKFDHLEFSWVKPYPRFYPARFKLTNKLRPNRLPLFFGEEKISSLIDVFDLSERFITSIGSEDAKYLRRPLLNFFVK